MLSFDMRTRSLARRRATTVIKYEHEEEEVDCNTRIVQEGMSQSSVYTNQVEIIRAYRWKRRASGETEQPRMHGCRRDIRETGRAACM